MTTTDKELIAILVFPIIVAIIIVSLMAHFSDTERFDVCEKVCYPNDQIGYDRKIEKCVCNMRIEYRDLK